MCVFGKKKGQAEPAPLIAPPPAPLAVADELTIDPKKKRATAGQSRNSRSSLVIQRSIGGVSSGSGLSIGNG